MSPYILKKNKKLYKFVTNVHTYSTFVSHQAQIVQILLTDFYYFSNYIQFKSSNFVFGMISIDFLEPVYYND